LGSSLSERPGKTGHKQKRPADIGGSFFMYGWGTRIRT
jgi:hypothetical protein